MKIHCKYDALVPIEDLKKLFNPRNRNQHPQSQIEHIALIMRENGVRREAIISKYSSFLTVGHGRILAAEFNKWTHYPVTYQDYDSEELEYADMTADNALAAQAELDIVGINTDIAAMVNFDIDLLGIKDFTIDAGEKSELDDKADKDSELKHILEVQFKSEAEMIEVYDDLLSRGLIVRCR